MAILALATDLKDLRTRLGKMICCYSKKVRLLDVLMLLDIFFFVSEKKSGGKPSFFKRSVFSGTFGKKTYDVDSFLVLLDPQVLVLRSKRWTRDMSERCQPFFQGEPITADDFGITGLLNLCPVLVILFEVP